MQWRHRTSLDWLKARQPYLTATDIKELLPVTKTGRSRKVDMDSYLKVLSRKLRKLTEDDCISYGAAARGHIMEPFAVQEFNCEYGEAHTGAPKMFHWDDALIAESPGLLAFSPDALDIEQPDGDCVLTDVYPQYGLEVKSYTADKHLICGHANKMELEERWQLAAAMKVCESIEKMYLMFYNPSMPVNFIHVYTREDLAEECEVIDDIILQWNDFIDGSHPCLGTGFRNRYDEQDIIKVLMEKEKLNPEKSVRP